MTSKLSRRTLIAGGLSLPLIGASSLAASAEQTATGYPSRPVKIVVPHPAGGGMDVITRKAAEIVARQTGSVIVVDNVPGASGNIGTGQVARARADGYTVVAINPTFSYVKYLFKTLPWTPEQEVVPVTTLIRTPDVVVVAGNSPYKNLRELIEYARANPGKLSYGTGGVGSPPHLAGEAFQQAAGIELLHVPYKGASEVIMGILSNSVTLMVSGTPSFTSYLKAGSLRGLSIAALEGKRLAAFPDIPTYTEAGLPALDTRTSWTWTGLAVPRGTPPEIIDFLQAAFQAAQQTQEYRDYVASQASLPGGLTSAGLVQQARDEQSYWHQVTQKAAIQPL